MHLGSYLTLYTKQAECNEWELKSSVKSEDKANLGAKSNKSWVYTSASYLARREQSGSQCALHSFQMTWCFIDISFFLFFHLCSSPGDPVTINAPNSIAGGNNCKNGRTQYHSACFKA